MPAAASLLAQSCRDASAAALGIPRLLNLHIAQSLSKAASLCYAVMYVSGIIVDLVKAPLKLWSRHIVILVSSIPLLV